MPLTDHCLCMFLKFDEKNKDVEIWNKEASTEKGI